MQKPTVGRVVHFFPATSDDLYRNGEPVAATIVRVWTDTCVNLALFDGDAQLHARTSVLLHQEGHALPDAGYAAWPARAGITLEAILDTTSGARPLAPLSDSAIEQRVREAGADSAPRVTKDQIDALMARVVYTYDQRPNGSTVTFAHALLDGWFFLASGTSACVSEANFNAEIGRQIAQSNAANAARDKLWELEGYRLRCQIAEGRFKPVAKVIDNNQPGWTTIIETRPHTTLDVGAQLYVRS
ncbi:Gp49 family protein [Paracidovorax cattleyae]|uniref:Gp49 family protein n=1 Tax=Paracidovorax cattleyae TaxID=80868 RepID=UPI0018AFFF8C|nr:Gp49 family protein [Paracidovorax cattleyae]MBF9263569.1 hypothetical protein [Paracidovorax cattleyae]